MPNPIGISFMPTAQAQEAGPSNAAANTDLAQAFKILSLRLPRILGPGAISPLGNAPGSSAPAFSGLNPYAAVFQALLQSLATGGLSGDRRIDTTGLGTAAATPSIVFGGGGGAGGGGGNTGGGDYQDPVLGIVRPKLPGPTMGPPSPVVDPTQPGGRYV